MSAQPNNDGKPASKAEIVTALADEWQRGGWANMPKRPDRAQERIAVAQFVTDWLRERAKEQ